MSWDTYALYAPLRVVATPGGTLHGLVPRRQPPRSFLLAPSRRPAAGHAGSFWRTAGRAGPVERPARDVLEGRRRSLSRPCRERQPGGGARRAARPRGGAAAGLRRRRALPGPRG